MKSPHHADAIFAHYAETLTGPDLKARLLRHARTISGTDPNVAAELVSRAHGYRFSAAHRKWKREYDRRWRAKGRAA